MSRKRFSKQEILKQLLDSSDSDVEHSSDSDYVLSSSDKDSDEERPAKRSAPVRPSSRVTKHGGASKSSEPGTSAATVSSHDSHSSSEPGTSAATVSSHDSHSSSEMQWKRASGTQADPPVFTRIPQVTIPTTDFQESDYFTHFVSDTLVDIFVSQTNRYVEHRFSTGSQIGPHANVRLLREKPTDATEMRKFIALIMLMGIVKKPEMNMYWSTSPLICTPLFSQVMKRNRFFAIMQFWHFCDPSTSVPLAAPTDKMYKIRSVIDHLQQKFESTIIPEQNLALDEELLLFKGRLGFRQYMPLKRSRFRVKVFCVCESSTAYVYKFRVYGGKNAPNDDMHATLPNDLPRFGITDKLVIFMLNNLLDFGHTVYMDNFYNNVALANYLFSRQTGVCGTLRKNRVPIVIRDAKLKKGQCAAFRDNKVMIVKYADKKDVHVISTIHDDSTVHVDARGPRRPAADRPVAISDYNKNMGGVDKMNQLLHPYDPCRKTLKWFRKVVIHLLHISMMNAWIVYKKSGGTKTLLQFHQMVIAQLLFSDDEHQDNDVPAVESLLRLTQKHFPDVIPPTDKKSRAQKRCRVCWARDKVRRDVRYHCPDCPTNPGLCFPACFKAYHTQMEYC